VKRIFWLACVFSSYAFASQTKFDFKCETSPKTTSFKFETIGDEMVLTTQHVNGIDFMPIHDGTIVPHDLEYLTSVASILKHMGSKNEFRFPKKKCKIYGEHLFSCSGGETKELDGVKMQALHIMTEKNTTEAFDYKIPWYKVILDVNIDGFVPVQEISMNYTPENCEFSF
jgi:hypothetical protein